MTVTVAPHNRNNHFNRILFDSAFLWSTIAIAGKRCQRTARRRDLPIMTIELSFPIFRNGSVLSAECKLTDNSRDTENAGKSTSIAFEDKINADGGSTFSVSEFRINLENQSMSNENITNDVVADSADQSAVDSVKDYSAKMACTNYVAFDDLYAEGNVRGRLVTQVPSMVASLRRQGFVPNHPLVVSKKPDGRFLVLRGNRRFLGLTHVREHHADEFGRILPGGRVPCIIHTDLTDREEILIRLDHSKDEDRVGLDDWSLFLAVKQLMRAEPDASEERIAEKLGIVHEKGKNAGKPNRSKIQPRVNLARLPEVVQEQFRLLWEDGKDATPVRVTDIKTLYKVSNDEFADYPDCDGPSFSAKWDEIMNPAPKADGADSEASTQKSDLTPSKAATISRGCSSPTVRRLLLALTGQGGEIGDLDAAVSAAETDSTILADIRLYLGDDDYAELINKSREYGDSVRAAEADNAECDDEVAAS